MTLGRVANGPNARIAMFGLSGCHERAGGRAMMGERVGLFCSRLVQASWRVSFVFLQDENNAISRRHGKVDMAFSEIWEG
jgi:hypothetical protein